MLKFKIDDSSDEDIIETIDDVKPLEEIRKMSFDDAREYLTRAKNQFPVAILTKHWDSLAEFENIYNSKVYNIFHSYDVEVNTERMRKAHEVKNIMAKQRQQERISSQSEEVTEENEADEFKQYRAIELLSQKSVFTIHLEGKMNGEQIAERIKSIANLLDYNTNYNIKIGLEEAGD